jgi:hypothetical protein
MPSEDILLRTWENFATKLMEYLNKEEIITTFIIMRFIA